MVLEYIQIGLYIFWLILFGIILIKSCINKFKNRKSKKENATLENKVLEESMKQNEDLQNENMLFSMIPNLIKQAEKLFPSFGKTGVSKMMYVIYELQKVAMNKNFTLDEEKVKSYIESILETPQKKYLTNDEKSDTNEIEIQQKEGEGNEY